MKEVNLIPVSDIETSEKQKTEIKDCLSTVETMKRLGYRSPSQILNLIKNNILPHSFQSHNRWWIPLSDIDCLERQTDPQIYLSTDQAAETLGYSKSRVSVK